MQNRRNSYDVEKLRIEVECRINAGSWIQGGGSRVLLNAM